MTEQEQKNVTTRREIIKRTCAEWLRFNGKNLEDLLVFRAECSADFERFLEAGGDVVVSEALSVVYGPTSTVSPDRVYAFFLLADKNIKDVVGILEELQDAHCMLETLAPIEQYTGKRTYTGESLS